MKQAIFLILLLVAISAHAQSVVKYRVFQDKSVMKGEKSDPSEGWEKADILVVLEAKKITVYAKTTLTIDFINNTKVYTNSKGNDEIDFSGITDDGSKVEGWIIFFKDQSGTHVGTIEITFPDFTMFYRLKNS